MKKNPRPMGIDPGLKCTTNVSVLYNLGPRKQGVKIIIVEKHKTFKHLNINSKLLVKEISLKIK
jgi:hypothetical protein